MVARFKTLWRSRESRKVLYAILGGKATVSLFPKGSVSFADVVLGDAARPALTAERLTARLRFFPLLIGRVEIADVSLERPTIAVDIEAEGKSNWSALIDAPPSSTSATAHRSTYPTGGSQRSASSIAAGSRL